MYLELPRSSNGYFKPLPGGGFASEMLHGGLRSESAVIHELPFRKRGSQKINTVPGSSYEIIAGMWRQRPFPNGRKFPFGCNSYLTAVAKASASGFILVWVALFWCGNL
jgi:hypothetical protein